MLRLRPDESDQRFIRRLLLVVLAVALAVFLYRISHLLLLAFGAMLGAVLLSTVANWLAERTPLSRGAGLVVTALLLFAALALIGWLFGAETGRQATRLGQQLPGDWARIEASLNGQPIGSMLAASIRKSVQGSQVAAYVAGAGWDATQIAINFIIVLVGALFLASQPGLYRRGLVMLAPPAHRPVARAAIDDVGRALRLWLLTQLVSMVMMGVMIGVGLWLSGVSAPVALGLLGGLSEFIPYVGPTLAMIPAVILGLAGSGSIGGVLATYAIVRIVQANVITPLISQKLITIPPGLYLFLILACGYAFGSFGLFFSGALSVAAYTLVIRLYSREVMGDGIGLPGEG